jgi:hypothetical protein
MKNMIKNYPWQVVARHHNWAVGCTISEAHQYQKDNTVRVRYTATILGFKNWKIYEGKFINNIANEVAARVRDIRNRIDSGDQNVFNENVTIKES